MPQNLLIPGRVLYVDHETIYLARGCKILRSFDGGHNWKDLVLVPCGKIGCALFRWSLVVRLLRKGVHHLDIGESANLIISDKETFGLDCAGLKHLGPLNGSRPMALCETGKMFYYGEYRSNPERLAVHVWKWRQGDSGWSHAWRFEEVRHVHGVFYDHYSGATWVTTGDKDSEAGIWRTDDSFVTLQKVAGGSQQLRAVQLLFTRDHVYFGSDAPEEKNYIYRMNRSGQNIERLVAVGSSVFYGCRVGESLFFSTAIEPRTVNSTRHAEVWRSGNGLQWQKILEFKKDLWSMKYFQYGQVFFPAGPGDGKHLYCTPFATKGHGKTIVINVETPA
ncbi:MAG: hypothetical protein BA863_01345 [Desulfovibrio sp. S3730MH75]|nr:MAG: hypothetical protein BA863_01345 [Desulfovibrio sp. S3730MH75]